MRIVKLVLSLLVGGLLALLTIVAVGIFSIQADGVRVGAVFDINNNITAVRDVGIPVVQYLGIAVLTAIVFFVVVLWSGKLPSLLQLVFKLGFVAVTAGLATWALFLEKEAGPTANGEQPRFALEGPEGWIQYGGVNSATHLLLVLVVASLFFAWPTRKADDRHDQRADDPPGHVDEVR